MKKIDPLFKRSMKQQGVVTVAFVAVIVVTLHVFGRFKFLNSASSTNDNKANNHIYAPDVVIRPSVAQWTVVMLRVEQLSDFWSKPWSAYISGFGSPGYDYWLGLSKIYKMVQNDNVRLRIEIQLQSDGKWYGVEYSTFAIAPEHMGGSYLLSVNGLSGDTVQLGDPLLSTDTTLQADFSSNGRLFSTYDYVSPKATNLKCAEKNGGGWWFGNCCNFCPTCNQYSCYKCAGYPMWMATRLLIKSAS